jgi:Tol biopolymer transport system component
MPRILLLTALLLICSGCLSGDSNADPVPPAAGCDRIGSAPDASAPPAGHRLAWAEGKRLWTLVDGCDAPQLLREHQGDIGRVRWSPEGDAIALQDATGTTVVRLDGAARPRSFGAEEFAWLDNEHLLIGRSRLPAAPYTTTLVVVDVNSGEEHAFDGAHSFAVNGPTVAFWQDAGPCPPSALPPAQVKPGAVDPIQRRCPRLVVRTPGEEQPAVTVDVEEMVAAMPGGVPSLGLTSPGRLHWSPDGEWIVFKMCGIAASGCVDTQHMFEVHVGSGVVMHVDDTSGPVAWAPDSRQYVYVREGGRVYDAYPRPLVLRRAGTTPAENRVLSPADVEDLLPAWSPDGSTIALTSFPSLRIPPCQACAPEFAGEGIWTMRSGGVDRVQLTSSPNWVDASPQWPADGEWILFERRGPSWDEDNGYPLTQLWLMRPDGSDQHMVADLSGAGPSNVPLHAAYDWWSAAADATDAD